MTEPTPPRWRRSVAPFLPGLAWTALLAAAVAAARASLREPWRHQQPPLRTRVLVRVLTGALKPAR